MDLVSSLDEHLVAYYRNVADFALLVAGGADLPTLIHGAAYTRDPNLARMVPRLSVCKSRISHEELAAFTTLAEDGSTTIRDMLARIFAEHCLREDILHCLANYYDPDTAAAWARKPPSHWPSARSCLELRNSLKPATAGARR